MISRLLILLSFLTIASCDMGGNPSFYMLTADGPAPSGGGKGIGVGPVSVAEYIDRPNLVVAESENKIGVVEDHRWAGDLSNSIARVTATNLGRRLHTGNVRVYPWRGDEGIQYQVVVDISQFHGGSDGYAILEASWRAYSLPDRKLKISRNFTDREPILKSDYQSLVIAESHLLSRLASSIAKHL